MNLLSLINTRLVKASSAKGGEYHGPCPLCGGRDRFHVWPEQGKLGTYWCRSCGTGGDAIQYLREVEQLTFRQACERLGVDPAVATPSAQSTLSTKPAFQPSPVVSPADLWQGKATAFVEFAHQKLLTNAAQLDWLAGRGIGPEMVAKYMLGWNPSDIWRERSAWGLPSEIKPETGRLKKMWLPQGLVIPVFGSDYRAVQVRIRRPEGDPRYFVVPGSSRSPLVSRINAEAYVVVESGLDAILLDGAAGDLVGAIAMHNATAKPPADLHQVLSAALHISVALDADAFSRNKATGKMEAAGPKASRWWTATYRQAERTPIIGGKDPGEAFKGGVDLRAWVLAGLPPRFQVLAEGRPEHDQVRAVQPPPQPPAGNHVTMRVGDRTVHTVDQRDDWARLAAAGEIVFSSNELARVKMALAACDHGQELVTALLDIKEVIPGAYIREWREADGA